MVELQASAGVVGGYHYAQRTANSYLALLFDKSRIKKKMACITLSTRKKYKRNSISKNTDQNSIKGATDTN